MTKFNVFAITVAIAMVTAVVVLTSVGQLTHTECVYSLIYIAVAVAMLSPFCIMDAQEAEAKAKEEIHNAWVNMKLAQIERYIASFNHINDDGGFIQVRYACGRFDVVYQSNNYYNPYAVRTSFHDDGTVWEDRVGFCNSQYGFETPEDKKLFEEYELIVAWQLGNQDAENFLREREENKI